MAPIAEVSPSVRVQSGPESIEGVLLCVGKMLFFAEKVGFPNSR